jgi:hypothetical protein
MSRHRHVEAYAALVLAGEYVEAGDSGRLHMHPGQVVVHDTYEAHQDHFSGAGAVVLNIPLSGKLDLGPGTSFTCSPRRDRRRSTAAQG